MQGPGEWTPQRIGRSPGGGENQRLPRRDRGSSTPGSDPFRGGSGSSGRGTPGSAGGTPGSSGDTPGSQQDDDAGSLLDQGSVGGMLPPESVLSSGAGSSGGSLGGGGTSAGGSAAGNYPGYAGAENFPGLYTGAGAAGAGAFPGYAGSVDGSSAAGAPGVRGAQGGASAQGNPNFWLIDQRTQGSVAGTDSEIGSAVGRGLANLPGGGAGGVPGMPGMPGIAGGGLGPIGGGLLGGPGSAGQGSSSDGVSPGQFFGQPIGDAGAMSLGHFYQQYQPTPGSASSARRGARSGSSSGTGSSGGSSAGVNFAGGLTDFGMPEGVARKKRRGGGQQGLGGASTYVVPGSAELLFQGIGQASAVGASPVSFMSAEKAQKRPYGSSPKGASGAKKSAFSGRSLADGILVPKREEESIKNFLGPDGELPFAYDPEDLWNWWQGLPEPEQYENYMKAHFWREFRYQYSGGIQSKKWPKALRKFMKALEAEDMLIKIGQHPKLTRGMLKKDDTFEGFLDDLRDPEHVDPAMVKNLNKAAIRRLARRGGVKRISKPMYQLTRKYLSWWLEEVLGIAEVYVDHRLGPKRSQERFNYGGMHYGSGGIVRTQDVVRALKKVGRDIYGYGAI